MLLFVSLGLCGYSSPFCSDLGGHTMATAQLNPGELLEISGYFWKTCALHAAVKLDVFTVIGEAI
jgi:hypothetical protein